MISQVYVPDPASVGQYMHDTAVELVRRGHRVVVLTAARGYHDPSVRYPSRERLDGVEVHRLPLSSFGKSSIPVRLLAQLSFLVQATVRGLTLPDIDHLLVSTSPPLASLAAIAIHQVRQVAVTHWVMDINPDQAVALGATEEDSLAARAFDAVNRAILRQADTVVALDEFMAARLTAKHPIRGRLICSPPWPHEDHLEPVPHRDNPFREEHGLNDKRVVMYSGNISPSHPVTTILHAAKRLETSQPHLEFLFVGDGNGRAEIENFVAEHAVSNIRLLPFQPLEDLKYSLSAADVHLVSMGPEMVGVVHPCKIYGAMAVARPILYLGPEGSHIGRIIEAHEVGWQVDHCDVDRAVELLKNVSTSRSEDLVAKGQRAMEAVRHHFSMDRLRGRFVDTVESSFTTDGSAGPDFATEARTATTAAQGCQRAINDSVASG